MKLTERWQTFGDWLCSNPRYKAAFEVLRQRSRRPTQVSPSREAFVASPVSGLVPEYVRPYQQPQWFPWRAQYPQQYAYQGLEGGLYDHGVPGKMMTPRMAYGPAYLGRPFPAPGNVLCMSRLDGDFQWQPSFRCLPQYFDQMATMDPGNGYGQMLLSPGAMMHHHNHGGGGLQPQQPHGTPMFIPSNQ